MTVVPDVILLSFVAVFLGGIVMLATLLWRQRRKAREPGSSSTRRWGWA